MRKTTWLKVAALWPALAILAAPGIAREPQNDPHQNSGDAVADAARKAREEKKATGKPKKVYTDDDVTRKREPVAGTQTEIAGATTAKPETAESSDAAEAKDAGAAAANSDTKKGTAAEKDSNGEAAWRKRFATQREKIARTEKELDILQRENQKAQVQYYPDPQKTLKEQYTRQDINEKEAKIAAKRQELAQLQQGLSDLEEQLHKAGGDSGWAR